MYDNLVADTDVELTAITQDLKTHLSEAELNIVNQIKQDDLKNHTDLIVEHGYTGPITDDNMDSISGAIVVNMLSRRMLALREFRRGLELYGLADLVAKHPNAARSLFVLGGQRPVDANYLVSILKPEYSPEGTSRRCKEEEVMDHFQDFLLTLEDEKISGYTEALAWIPPDVRLCEDTDADKGIDVDKDIDEQEKDRYVIYII